MLSNCKWHLFSAGLGSFFAIIAFGIISQPATIAYGSQAPQTPPNTKTIVAFAKGGCAVCHTIPGIPNAIGQVGPDLSAIGDEAGMRISGTGADDYLRQSILDPGAFIAPLCPSGDCPENVMPPNFGEKLTNEEITLVVNYLLTLTGEEVTAPLYEFVPIVIIRPAEASITPFTQPPKEYADAQVLLGKYLFFDPRLSGDVNISCSSCHQPDKAWTDGLALSDGYPSTLYFRNTPTIMNTVYADYLYWDGRMDGADMPTLIRDHLTEAHFMNMDGRLMVERIKQVPEYVQLFQDTYGSPPSFGGVLNAITAYVQSLNSGLSPYDRYIAGDESALLADALAGLALFEGQASCTQCHNGSTFSDGKFYALGVPENPDIWGDPLRHITFRRFFRQLGISNYRILQVDLGLFALTRQDSDQGAFRTSPLREINLTAPYMHNGVFATLEEVLAFYNAGAVDGTPLGLTDTEIMQLIAFLESLTSSSIEVEVPILPDYQLRTLGDNR